MIDPAPLYHERVWTRMNHDNHTGVKPLEGNTTLPRGLAWLRKFEFPRKLGICEALYGRRLAPRNVCWVETAAGLAWKLDLANPTHRWIVYGKYEGRPFLDWARDNLQPDSIIVDSGANIGQMLLYLAQCVPNGRVYAFEPCTEAADWLEECLARHPHLPAMLIRAALGEAPGAAFLEGVGSFELHGACNQISQTRGEPVSVVRLDDFLLGKGVREVALWKLDVEGHELQALRGAEELLRAHAIKAIYAELGFGNGERIVEYLRAFDYSCQLFDARGALYVPSHLPAHTNALFLPHAKDHAGICDASGAAS